MKKAFKKIASRTARRRRIRSRISGSQSRPRLSVFRSAQHIYAQLIDDEKGTSLAQISSVPLSKKQKLSKKQMAELVGKLIAEAAQAKGFSKVAFDRGGFDYSGRVRALAEAARKAGLEF